MNPPDQAHRCSSFTVDKLNLIFCYLRYFHKVQTSTLVFTQYKSKYGFVRRSQTITLTKTNYNISMIEAMWVSVPASLLGWKNIVLINY